MSFIGKFIDRKFFEPAHRMKVSQFVELDPPTGAIAFIGDSITEGGAWHEWFPEHRVINRGISADTSAGVRKRIAVAVRHAPAAVFLLIGTNDIGRGRKTDEIVADVEGILRAVRTHAPDARIVLQSVMPRQAKYRTRIEDVNANYRRIAGSTPSAEYLNLWPTFADRDSLRGALTVDGLHLNGAGYRVWTDVLRPLLPSTKP
ncbi:GDSL-type esterase/lipase family protein [Herbiconiux sp. CPCC 203407]|uniref:GDSL-type esterase/lipase family protein n=1 Tax=Herbiconiux oxytropis TaxID=2970915 RepID=A0AA41XIV9_9MICO|nr:GDSL-type esterase/lipase family protein [Herbiconiux oxytropis]MCS5721838.1 GDSL-type esterase/lipase family protein [Herbiconiux oxytropis]MCS5727364.1 GDSL-type esterase/lipase family protein [Herbiconiux oxytropis]